MVTDTCRHTGTGVEFLFVISAWAVLTASCVAETSKPDGEQPKPTDDSKAIAHLCKLLASDDAAVRAAAAKDLVETGDAARAMTLDTWSEAKETELRGRALAVLQGIDRGVLIRFMLQRDSDPVPPEIPTTAVDLARDELKSKSLDAAALAKVALDAETSLIVREAALRLLEKGEGLPVEDCLRILHDKSTPAPLRRLAAILLGRHREPVAVGELLHIASRYSLRVWQVVEGALIGLDRIAKGGLLDLGDYPAEAYPSMVRQILVMAARDRLARRLTAKEDLFGVISDRPVDFPPTLQALTAADMSGIEAQDRGKTVRANDGRPLIKETTEGELRYVYGAPGHLDWLIQRTAPNKTMHNFAYDPASGTLTGWSVRREGGEELVLILTDGIPSGMKDELGRTAAVK